MYWLWSMLIFVAIVVQVGFAGYGAFNAAGKLEDEGAVVSEDMFMATASACTSSWATSSSCWG